MARTLEHAPQPDPVPSGATAVITHLVRAGHEADYEQWLDAIGSAVRQWPGHLDWHLIRPVAGVTHTYVVVIRFQNRDFLDSWIRSDVRTQFVDRVRPWLEADDQYHIRSGLDFWFVPEGTKVPVRWKQAVMTWSAIYPLVFFAPLLVLPLLRGVGLPSSRLLDTLVITGVVVALMVYVVMPRYARLLRPWLFR